MPRSTWQTWLLTEILRGRQVPWQRMEDRINWTTLLVKLWQQVSRQIESLRWTISASGPWKDFLNLGAMKSTTCQKCWNHLSSTLGTRSTSGTLGWHQVAVLHPQGADAVGLLEVALLPSFPFDQVQEENKTRKERKKESVRERQWEKERQRQWQKERKKKRKETNTWKIWSHPLFPVPLTTPQSAVHRGIHPFPLCKHQQNKIKKKRTQRSNALLVFWMDE